jgi:MFS transporter, SP family, inositol transporter
MTSIDVQPRPQRYWRTSILAGMASYLDSAALVSSGTAVSVLYAPELHLDPAAIGLVLACQQLAFGTGALFGGRLGDIFGRRRVFTISLIGFAVAMAILASASSQGMLFTGVILAGLSVGADLPVSLAMANESAPKGKKGQMVILAALMWTLGIASVQLVISLVGHLGATGARILFGELLVTTIIVLLLRLTVGESTEWVTARDRAAEQPKGKSGSETLNHVGQIFRRPVLSTVVAVGLFYAAWNVGASIQGKYGGYMWTKLAGGDIETFSRMSLIALPITFGASILFMRLVDTKWRRPAIIVGSLLILVGWFPLAFFGATQFSLIAMVFVWGLGSCFAGEGLYKVWSQELIPTLLRATGQGLTMFFARVVAAILALVVPTMLAGTPNIVFTGIFVAAAVSVLIAWMWLPRLRAIPGAGAPNASETTADPTVLPAPPETGMMSK